MAKKSSTRPAARKKRHGMKVEEPVFVTMRDGVRIACRIYRPDAPGKFPVLFAASPYQFETDDLPHSTQFLWREVGPVEWYVRDHGYVYVHMDVRGTGQSGGTYGLLDKDEQQDYYDCIEWVGRQEWCDGNVGGIGQSYYAWSQWFMGIVNPPSLKCIAPYDGAVDMYRGTAYHGGIYCDFMPWWYQMLRVNNLQRASNGPGGQYLPLDLAGEMARHQTYDAWWKERCIWERLDEIKVPVLSIGHWGKMGLHLRGNIVGYEEVKAPKKLVVTGARDVFEAHDQFDHIEYHERELLPFYDRYLKGKKNGWEKRPEVRLYVNGRGEWREEEAWPVKGARTVPFHLSRKASNSVTSLNDGTLTPDKPAKNGGSTDFSYPQPGWKLGTVGMGPQGPDTIRNALTFTTPPAGQGSRGGRADRPGALRLVHGRRYGFLHQAVGPAPAGRRCPRQESSAGLSGGVQGLAAGVASREGRKAQHSVQTVLYPCKSAADRAGQGLQVRCRGDAVRASVPGGASHPAGNPQRRFAGDGCDLHAPVSLLQSRNGHLLAQ